MQPARRAVIDVGTNSVKLLIAEMRDGVITPLLEESDQTRLGAGFYETHRLQPDAIGQTSRAVTRFAALAAEWKAGSIRLVATSAARDAENQADLVRVLESACGLPVEVISGEQEAEWVFRGVTSDPKLAGCRLLILDVGGGSTEFILGEGEHHVFRESFPLGAVRLLEKLRPGDPPSLADLAGCRTWLRTFFNQQQWPALESLLRGGPPVRLVGTGGTATILARIERKLVDFDRDQIEGTRLSRHQLLQQMVHLWSVPLAERRKIAGLPAKRADIIPMGAAIYEAVMEHFRFDELYVSTRGLRFGALLDFPPPAREP
jgi:exopolyphosphatase/guanosine-5'-triphosphate,3'-diphosphate pyrophosphatase